MKKQLSITMLFGLFFLFHCYSQETTNTQKFTLSGYVTDAVTGEKLIAASVYDVKTYQGTQANEYGYYSLTLPAGTYEIAFSYVGYQEKKFEITLDQDRVFNVELTGTIDLDEAEIIGHRLDKIEERSEMSTVDLQMRKVKELPVLLGEQDVMKVIQLLPGVQSGGEGTSGLYVRGGGPDQNLILLDGVPIYNASHLFGFFSVFNSDAINSVKLIKGGFPAHYGGRLSSVIDIRMKEGNNKKFKGSGSIGLISSKLTLEGPIKEKTSFIVSARRTYIDILARPFIKAANNQTNGIETSGGYYFYDLNAKINHTFSERSRLYLSGYFGKDKFYFKEKYSNLNDGRSVDRKIENNLSWGNAIAALRWNYVITPKLFSNTTLTYSKYGFQIGNKEEQKISVNDQADQNQTVAYKYYSQIDDISAKIDFDYSPKSNHLIKFGTGLTHHTFTPSTFNLVVKDDEQRIDSTIGNPKIMALEMRTFFEDNIEINERLKANFGLHLSNFFVDHINYISLEPRASIRYMLNENTSAKVSYADMTQYLHLLSNSGIGLPTDLWLPPTKKVKPQNSKQVALGLAKTFKKKFEVSLEGYYKVMNNLIEYKDGASFFDDDLNSNWEEKITQGEGTSYGVEFLVEKKVGDFTGWIGYTWSKTDRLFEEINFGEKYPYKYDRRNDIGLALSYKFNDHVDMGFVWVYGTGNAVTLGLERYTSYDGVFNPDDFGGLYGYGYNEIEHIEHRNNYRMPAYHRLDVGVNLHKDMKWGKRTWSFGVYNLYNRKNPFYLNFIEDADNNRKLQQISLFPLIPSFSYQFEF